MSGSDYTESISMKSEVWTGWGLILQRVRTARETIHKYVWPRNISYLFPQEELKIPDGLQTQISFFFKANAVMASGDMTVVQYCDNEVQTRETVSSQAHSS